MVLLSRNLLDKRHPLQRCKKVLRVAALVVISMYKLGNDKSLSKRIQEMKRSYGHKF